MDTSPTPSTPAGLAPDAAEAARDVSLRLEQWYLDRGLALPPETQAGFLQMGLEAIALHPDRPRGDVLDQLIGELDTTLGRIRAEPRGDAPPDAAIAPAKRPGWFRRTFGGRGRPR